MAACVTLSENAQLAADTLEMKPRRGIPSTLVHAMDIPFIEHIAGKPAGTYRLEPDRVYLDFERAAGVCMIDQYLADNPSTMTNHGYDGGAPRTATTGAESLVLDGITIDSPEAVAEHLVRFVFPSLERAVAEFDAEIPDSAFADTIVAQERESQRLFGAEILKAPYGGDFGHFPCLRYGDYGYAAYLMAYLVYPELMERDFALQAELASKRNRVAADAIIKGGLPRVLRLDHDMADSRGMLVDIRSLDRIWFPHFARAIKPYLDAGIRLLWHCDGNLSAMIPRLLEVGIGGFQGFQYEDGMDYESLCRTTTRDGDRLMIWGGVSVTRTLPFGTPDDVRSELAWLVKHAPPVGFFLAGSSSIVPGTPWKNLNTFLEGLAYYRIHGR